MGCEVGNVPDMSMGRVRHFTPI